MDCFPKFRSINEIDLFEPFAGSMCIDLEIAYHCRSFFIWQFKTLDTNHPINLMDLKIQGRVRYTCDRQKKHFLFFKLSVILTKLNEANGFRCFVDFRLTNAHLVEWNVPILYLMKLFDPLCFVCDKWGKAIFAGEITNCEYELFFYTGFSFFPPFITLSMCAFIYRQRNTLPKGAKHTL